MHCNPPMAKRRLTLPIKYRKSWKTSPLMAPVGLVLPWEQHSFKLQGGKQELSHTSLPLFSTQPSACSNLMSSLLVLVFILQVPQCPKRSVCVGISFWSLMCPDMVLLAADCVCVCVCTCVWTVCAVHCLPYSRSGEREDERPTPSCSKWPIKSRSFELQYPPPPPSLSLFSSFSSCISLLYLPSE